MYVYTHTTNAFNLTSIYDDYYLFLSVEDMKMLEFLCTTDENVKCYSHYEVYFGGSSEKQQNKQNKKKKQTQNFYLF